VQALSGQVADTTATRPGDTKSQGRTRSPLNPFAALAHGSRIVANILPRHLPSAAALGHGLDGDAALIMRIAKVLALVYAGFLIIWFWATRVRWNGR
jgi:hypothetical protein